MSRVDTLPVVLLISMVNPCFCQSHLCEVFLSPSLWLGHDISFLFSFFSGSLSSTTLLTQDWEHSYGRGKWFLGPCP